MERIITLYHGSEQLIEEPTFGKGKGNNDFGLGFYCTESEDLAKEWAVSSRGMDLPIGTHWIRNI